jgi:DNA repair ATPase RecN
MVNNDRSSPVVSQIFDGFAGNYERELIQKDHLIKEKKNELELSKKRLIGTQHTSEQIQFDPTKLEYIEEESDKLTLLLKKQTLQLQKESLSQLASQYEEENIDIVEEKESVDSLLEKLNNLKQARKEQTQKLIDLRLKTPSKRHQEYKRLISMCCNVSYENVDLMLLPLLSSFDELGSHSSSSLSSPPLHPRHPTL